MVAARRAEQPDNDRYVGIFVLVLFGFMVGYGLGKYHEKNFGRAAVEQQR